MAYDSRPRSHSTGHASMDSYSDPLGESGQRRQHKRNLSLPSNIPFQVPHRSCLRVATVSASLSSAWDANGGVNPKRKSVAWNQVQVREFARTVGDNPSCSSGPPLTIDWEHTPRPAVYTVDRYENDRPPRKSQFEMVLPREERQELLMEEWKISQTQIVTAVRTNMKAKNQRRRTVNNLGKMTRLEEAMESAQRKLKRAVTFQRSTSRQVEDMTRRSMEAQAQRDSLVAHYSQDDDDDDDDGRRGDSHNGGVESNYVRRLEDDGIGQYNDRQRTVEQHPQVPDRFEQPQPPFVVSETKSDFYGNEAISRENFDSEQDLAFDREFTETEAEKVPAARSPLSSGRDPSVTSEHERNTSPSKRSKEGTKKKKKRREKSNKNGSSKHTSSHSSSRDSSVSSMNNRTRESDEHRYEEEFKMLTVYGGHGGENDGAGAGGDGSQADTRSVLSGSQASRKGGGSRSRKKKKASSRMPPPQQAIGSDFDIFES